MSASVPLSAPSKDLSQDSYGLSSQARTTRDPKGKGWGSDRPRREGRESGRQSEQNRTKTTKPKRGRDRGAEPDRQKRPKTKQTERDYRMKICWESTWITVGKSGHRPTNTEPLFNAGTPELKALASPFGHSVSQRQSRPRGRQTPRAMGRSPRNVCEKLRHSDTSQRGTETSM